MPSEKKAKGSCQPGGTCSGKLVTGADPAAEVQLRQMGNVHREVGGGTRWSTSITTMCAEAESMPFLLRCTEQSEAERGGARASRHYVLKNLK